MPHVFTPGFVPPWPPTEAAPAPKQFTLVIPRRPGRVLLGLKLRGFGTGFWNGFGGKVEPGETVEVAAKRELLEEAGIRALDLARMGTLHFHWQEQAQAWEVAVFTCTQWEGTEGESDEMRPQWWAEQDVPYSQMWQDDVHWWPHLLAGERFGGAFFFRNTTELVSFDLRRESDA